MSGERQGSVEQGAWEGAEEWVDGEGSPLQSEDMTSRRGSKDDYPRAPTQEEWDALSPEERQRVADALPGEVTDAEMSPPEGDLHFQAKVQALDTLRGHFTRQRRRAYLAAELPVYYPGERRFAPDILVVLDADAHARSKWVVGAEGKGLDVVFEVHVGGDRKKDAHDNVLRYARLGISEYFIYDRDRLQLLGYRLPEPSARVYAPIPSREGGYLSERLGLKLRLEGDRLRFYSGQEMLLDPEELIARLQQLTDGWQRRADEEARLRREEARLRREDQRRVEQLQAEVERLKRGR